MNKTEIQAFCKKYAESSEAEKWQRYEEAKQMIPDKHRRGYRYNEYIDIITKALKM